MAIGSVSHYAQKGILQLGIS